MKLYYFAIIAIGIMYTFSLAGIDTASSGIIDYLQVGNDDLNSTVINPSSSASTTSGITGAQTFWGALAAFFILFGVLTAVKINIGIAQLQATTEGLIAAIASLIFGFFAIDFFSILKKMYELTGGVGWQFHITWIIIVPTLFGFAVSIIQFIKGTE